MATRKTYTVNAPLGRLNVREKPSIDARILFRISSGEKVKIDAKTDAPEGWLAIEAGGFVMAQYLK